jgi:hypothetical protein
MSVAMAEVAMLLTVGGPARLWRGAKKGLQASQMRGEEEKWAEKWSSRPAMAKAVAAAPAAGPAAVVPRKGAGEGGGEWRMEKEEQGEWGGSGSDRCLEGEGAVGRPAAPPTVAGGWLPRGHRCLAWDERVGAGMLHVRRGRGPGFPSRAKNGAPAQQNHFSFSLLFFNNNT